MAEFLRQNEIRVQLLQKFFVNLVNVAAALLNFPVNLKASVDLLVNRRLRQNGPVRSLRRIIALVGHRQLGPQAQVRMQSLWRWEVASRFSSCALLVR